MRSRTLTSLLTIIFLVLLAAATLATRGTKASPDTLYVSTDGVCGGYEPCYINVQAALDAALPFDEILVATGTYTDPVGTVATIYKTITLEGGWHPSFAARSPEAYPTTLDAQGQGRAVFIYDDITPTIDGFIITGGDATGETSYPAQGGGIYSIGADPIIVNNVITNNIASTSTSTDTLGYGGGIFLSTASASAVVSGNQMLSNTASTGDEGLGGGLYLNNSAATVTGNTISDNIASTADHGQGGGLCLWYSDATISGNTISDNIASTAASGEGGGLVLHKSAATVDGNRIISNTASGGGGLYVYASAPFTLTNNIIAQNEADGVAGGILVWGWSISPASGALINNTIAQNNLGSGGEGVCAQSTTTLTLTNNVVVSHTWGIYFGGVTATADYTLFFGNTMTDTAGTITSTNEITGDPLFVDPSAWDYHIQVASPAINKGTFSGAPATDFEGDPRPYDCFIDIGADENTTSDYCQRVYLPLIMKNY